MRQTGHALCVEVRVGVGVRIRVRDTSRLRPCENETDLACVMYGGGVLA